MKMDHELLASILQKDAAALELLYDRYAGLLYKIVLVSCKDSHLSEKILTELFNDIWHNPLKFSQGTFVSAAIITACKDKVKHCPNSLKSCKTS